ADRGCADMCRLGLRAQDQQGSLAGPPVPLRYAPAPIPRCLSLVLLLVDPILMFLSERTMALDERHKCPGLFSGGGLRGRTSLQGLAFHARARVRSRPGLAGCSGCARSVSPGQLRWRTCGHPEGPGYT